MRRIPTIALLGLAGGCVAASAARADDCAIVMAAAIAQLKVPYATTMTTAKPGEPTRQNLVIATGSKMYVQVNGTWRSMAMSTQAMIDQMMATQKKTTQTCAKAGSDTVNGEAATIYTGHSENGKTIADNRIWISDRSGLPLKLEAHFQDGLTVTQTTRYDNIQAPAGAK